MNKTQAIKLLHEHMQNSNLRRHCYGVSYAMGGIYDYLESKKMLKNEEPVKEVWEILGILHDSDYEITKDDWRRHTLETLKWLDEEGINKDDPLYKAIQSHNTKITHLREPETQMEWALECCDELTGFIVACTLVLPDKKLSSLNVESVLKKWKQPAFARAVDRAQIEQCEDKLKIPLKDFIEIVLQAMQKNSSELGL